MINPQPHSKARALRNWKFSDLDWINFSFLILTPLAAAIWTPFHIYFNGFDLRLLFFFFVYSIMTSISITAGYHRLFAHRTYEARPWLKLFLLVFGAAAFQNSALKWATDHRRHHQYVDKPQDPYSIKRGFFFAHMGWIFFKDRGGNDFAPDLAKDPLVQFQHKYYLALAIVFGFLVPFGVGALFHSPFGGLLFGGILRVVFTHHCTFLINSLCHTVGNQPYTDQNSARDSFVMAFFTYGEGYHNFHHQFQLDYRNGIKWYHWDPTKWFIGALNLVGQTRGLKKVHTRDILKAKVEHQAKIITLRGAPLEKVQTLKSKFDEAQNRLRALHDEVKLLGARLRNQNKNHNMHRIFSEKIVEMKLAKVEMQASLKQWKIYAKNWSESGSMAKGF